jgi:hypothetical protein
MRSDAEKIVLYWKRVEMFFETEEAKPWLDLIDKTIDEYTPPDLITHIIQGEEVLLPVLPRTQSPENAIIASLCDTLFGSRDLNGQGDRFLQMMIISRFIGNKFQEKLNNGDIK